MDSKSKPGEGFTIHRYGLRMPIEVFRLIDEIAWESKLSTNMALVELIRESLVSLARDKSLGQVKADFGGKPLGWKNLTDLAHDGAEKEKKGEIESALLILEEWMQANT